MHGSLGLAERRGVQGVTIYISDFKRSLSDKLAKNFFSEPSQVRESLPLNSSWYMGC